MTAQLIAFPGCDVPEGSEPDVWEPNPGLIKLFEDHLERAKAGEYAAAAVSYVSADSHGRSYDACWSEWQEPALIAAVAMTLTRMTQR